MEKKLSMIISYRPDLYIRHVCKLLTHILHHHIVSNKWLRWKWWCRRKLRWWSKVMSMSAAPQKDQAMLLHSLLCLVPKRLSSMSLLFTLVPKTIQSSFLITPMVHFQHVSHRPRKILDLINYTLKFNNFSILTLNNIHSSTHKK